MDVTVALCTRNRAARLVVALAGLARQRTSLRWELLVVDNASEDETPAVVARAGASLGAPLRLVRELRPGISHARNRALAEARGALLLFLDDDTVPRDGWLAAHARALAEDPGVVGSGGRVLPVLPAEMPSWLRAAALERNGGPAARYDFGDVPLPVGPGTGRPLPFGANLGLRRSATHALEFRTDLGWGARLVSGEETDFLGRLAERGGRFRYVPDAVVDHHIAPERCTPAYFERWYRGRGRAAVRIDPPPTLRVRLARSALEAHRVVRWSLQAWHTGSRADDADRERLLRKRAKAWGRLSELLAFTPAARRGRAPRSSAPPGSSARSTPPAPPR